MSKAENLKEAHFIGCFVSQPLFEAIESYCKRHGYTNKSEFLRQALRKVVGFNDAYFLEAKE